MLLGISTIKEKMQKRLIKIPSYQYNNWYAKRSRKTKGVSTAI